MQILLKSTAVSEKLIIRQIREEEKKSRPAIYKSAPLGQKMYLTNKLFSRHRDPDQTSSMAALAGLHTMRNRYLRLLPCRWDYNNEIDE